MNYTDYYFYVDTYKGDKIPPDYFEKISLKASIEIRNSILNKDITGYEYDVQMATCAVSDIIYNIELAENRINQLISKEKADKVISSEKVANISITYANITSISDLEKYIIEQKNKINDVISCYLFATGLLNRKVYIKDGRFI